MSRRRVYSEEFKRDAVKLAEPRRTIGAAARELGVDHMVFRRCKERLAANSDLPFPGNGNALDVELAGRKRKNRAESNLRMDCPLVQPPTETFIARKPDFGPIRTTTQLMKSGLITRP